MKIQWFLIPSLALVLVACTQPTKIENKPVPPDNQSVRSADANLPTATDQFENKSDVNITQQIRRNILRENFLSEKAKNVVIITQNGIVTLRGPVGSAQEKTAIESSAKKVPGVKGIHDFLDIVNS
jgi:hyperosmotically inducible periplasmic protein